MRSSFRLFTAPRSARLTTVLTTSNDLLLQILHADPTLPEPKKLEVLKPHEWEALTAEAIRYRLTFQFNEYLKAHTLLHACVPESCLVLLSQTVQSALMENMRQLSQLRQMLRACEAESIPFLLMKGLWIVDQLYQNMAARASGDIDILLKPEDMPRFTRLVQRLGFEVDLTIIDFQEIAQVTNEFQLPTFDGSSRFDVHWSMTHPLEDSPINEDKIWARSDVVNLVGKPCQSLCLEDHLLMLCYHAAIHHRFRYVGPRVMSDIAQAIKTPPRPILWEELVARAHEMGWSRGVWLMLDLVREHLGVQPPQSILDAMRPYNAEDSSIRKAAVEAMFMDQQHKEGLTIGTVRLFNQAPCGQRFEQLFRGLFPEPRLVALHFQVSIDDPRLPWIYPWLYAKRLGLMLQEQAPKLIQLISGNPQRRSELHRSQTIVRWLES